MRAIKPGPSVRELVLLALCTALIFGLQVAMAPLPNIEPVTLLIMLYTRMFHRRTLYIIYAFALLEGLLYGFGIWWIMYLYVWTLLWLAVTLLGPDQHPVVMAVTAGVFGLVFGALCAIPYIFISGIPTAFAWWVAGIPFDLIHGVSNFLIALVLYAPLSRLTDRLMQQLR
jgi:energy-coupling factor transport system substrate-specific component